MRRVGERGLELDATFSIAGTGDQLTLTIESRGGTRGAANARNMDYDRGLEILLGRLKERRASITDALVVSSTALRAFPAEEDRRLDVAGGYPIRLADRDPDELRREFGRAQRRAARNPALTSSGNNNKRVEFSIAVPTRSGSDAQTLEAELAVGEPDQGQRTPSPITSDLPADQASSTPAPSRHRAVSSAKGQGYVADAVYRRAVELHAMVAATNHYQKRGWLVEDTSADSPYDLVVRRRGEKRYVEVKGTAGTGQQVNMTAGEVDHARGHPGAVVLFIVHSIEVDASDPNAPVAAGGATTIIDPFDPDSGTLRPAAFTWRAPVAPDR